MITPTARRAAGILAALVLSVFAYGYWHSVTHAVLRTELRDFNGEWLRLPDAAVKLSDERGRELAGLTTDRLVLSISEPAGFSCREIERGAAFTAGGHESYLSCFKRQTRWTAAWVEAIKTADVTVGACAWNGVPVSLRKWPTGPADWWIFWPLPHLGGVPYTHYDASVTIDSRECAALKPSAVRR